MTERDNKLWCSWENVTDEIDNLVSILSEKNLPIDSIYGIPRGGLIPAVMLSHKLDLPFVLNPTENTLVVDDISDSGLTLGDHHLHGAIYTLTLHMRNGSKYEPTIYGKFIDSDKWIVYPWELSDSQSIQDYKLTK